ncbi:MAG: histidine ammonia-lyase [Oligoflexales bacterium]
MIISYKNKMKLQDIWNYVYEGSPVMLDKTGTLEAKIERNHQFFLATVASGQDVYGVTTGFGQSSKNRFDKSLSQKLQVNLYNYHGCGVGPSLSEQECAAVTAIRLNCFSQGVSGVSYDLLRQIELLLDKRIFPVIPSQGSVGASGDLTPLSYLAAVMAGERMCYANGKVEPAGETLARVGIKPYAFKAREALAIMNGTSVMCGIASLALREVMKCADLACDLTALLVELLGSRTAPFASETHSVKPHPGQVKAAARIWSGINQPYLKLNSAPSYHRAIQDPYSIRCAPHVIGVLYDAIDSATAAIENEVNSASDNPVFLDDAELVLNSGHFFGGHIAHVCDNLKTALANTINLMDRQIAHIMDLKDHSYLPENLVATKSLGEEAILHHGFKAMQITLSALSSEILKNSMPISIFSRPTESSNQDVVSLGTIAARELAHLVNLSRDSMAVTAMFLRQGFFVAEENGYRPELGDRAKGLLGAVGESFPAMIADRPLDHDITQVGRALFATRT